MANRRVAPPDKQPKEFSFTAENAAWAQKQIAKYPAGRQQSAIIPLLWRAQEQNGGWLPEAAIRFVSGMLGMAHVWPSPDPIVQDMKTYAIAVEQPYIHRLTRLGVEAQRRGRGIAFAYEVSHLIFGGTRDWHLGDHLAQAAQRAGLELAAMDAAIADPASHIAAIEENQQALTAAGHWGVPTFALEGEPFFGEDRIDTLRWRLGQMGLVKTAKE